MTTTEISKATVESVLENGNDALFGTLFWYLIAGLPGALLHRLVNTLDAMWGYKTDHYLHFGWAAARLDDLLNWIPARLCALTYALLGKRKQALSCWRRQAKSYESPNGGPIMAAGAGALGIRLGGPAIYHGKLKVKPFLGVGPEATPQDINRAVRLLNGGVLLWLVLIISVNLVVIA
jgi:adenosylcobinamide-phosphate synthase